METDELINKIKLVGELIDTLNIHKNKNNISVTLQESFTNVIDYFNSIYDSLDQELTDINNSVMESWLELYREENNLKLL